MKLLYKTKGMTNPKGKAKVFFCCHINDFKWLFDDLSDSLIKNHDCAVWYVSPEQAGDYSNLSKELSQMQLFVIPVTYNLLNTKNEVIDFIFPFADEKHIPVLPILCEEGLAEPFNKMSGSRHCIDRTLIDQIEFDEKVDGFLSDVLYDNDLAAEARKAFCAYIFLSYRKKDKEYVHQFIESIHSDRRLRDVAVWWDEYLTIGEDFNNSIRTALKESNLFALLVTPSVLEKPNYVVNEEYPEAIKENKKILAVEYVPTKADDLKASFANIEKAILSNNREQLCDVVYDSLKPYLVSVSDEDYKHAYYIGMAYLNGIDVEVDNNKAVELITLAAESGYMDAMIQMVSMYLHGKGVEINVGAAIEWQERIISQLESNPQEGIDYILNLMNELWYLGEFYWDILDREKCMLTYRKMTETGERFKSSRKSSHKKEKDKNQDLNRLLSVAYEHIGNMYEREKDFENALRNYNVALKIKSVQPKKSKNYNYDLACCCKRLGILFKERKDYERSLKYFQTALKYCFLDYEECDNADEIIYLMSQVAKVFLESGNNEKAEEVWKEAIDFADDHMQEYKYGYENLTNLPDCFVMLGLIAQKYENKIDFFKKSIDIIDEILKNKPSVYTKLMKVRILRMMEIPYVHIGKEVEAQKCCELSFEISKELYDQYKTTEIIDNYAVAFCDRGYFYKICNKKQDAFKWLSKCIDFIKGIEKKTDSLYSTLADAYQLTAVLSDKYNVDLLVSSLQIWEYLNDKNNGGYDMNVKYVKSLIQGQ